MDAVYYIVFFHNEPNLNIRVSKTTVCAVF